MKTTMMRYVGKYVWLINAISCIAIGMNTLGVNIINVMNLGQYEDIVFYIIGISGVISFIFFLTICCNDYDKRC